MKRETTCVLLYIMCTLATRKGIFYIVFHKHPHIMENNSHRVFFPSSYLQFEAKIQRQVIRFLCSYLIMNLIRFPRFVNIFKPDLEVIFLTDRPHTYLRYIYLLLVICIFCTCNINLKSFYAKFTNIVFKY